MRGPCKGLGGTVKVPKKWYISAVWLPLTVVHGLWISLKFVQKEKHFCVYLLLASPSAYLKIVLKPGWGLEWNKRAPKIGGQKHVQFNSVSFSTAHNKSLLVNFSNSLL